MYRIRQFIWAILSYFKKLDMRFVREYLNREEEKIFSQLSKNEQHHSLRVCKSAFEIVDKEYENVNKEKLAKIALLHDVGKVEYKLNVFEKSIIVLLDKFTHGKISEYDKLKQINIYYNHGKIGADMLASYKTFDNEMLQIVEEHHKENEALKGNKLYRIIVEADNRN